MNEEIKEILHELSEIYDPDSLDTFVSLYYKKDLDTKFIERRKKACRTILKKDLLKNFELSFAKIEDIINKNKKENIVVFSSAKNNFFKYLTVPVEIENTLIVDSSPYLRPLERMIDEWESFNLLLLNTNSAKIYTVSLGEVTDTKKLSKDIMNKHKKGGCSQARFNRLRRGAIHEFYKEVIDELRKNTIDKLVIAGPGNAKKQLIDILPVSVKEKIVDTIDISIDDEKQLLEKSLYLISEKEQRQSHEAVQHLKAEILKDGLAVYGYEETLQAVKNGQVELLIIEKDYKLPGWICEKCQAVGKGSKNNCPYCNNRVSKVDVVEEILEFAERTDAEIEFTDDEDIKNLGHIGGILRYK